MDLLVCQQFCSAECRHHSWQNGPAPYTAVFTCFGALNQAAIWRPEYLRQGDVTLSFGSTDLSYYAWNSFAVQLLTRSMFKPLDALGFCVRGFCVVSNF